MSSDQRVAGADAFVFDVGAPLVRFTDHELLEGLKRYAAVHGPGPFRCRDFRAWKERPFDAQTVMKRFGSWRKALWLIGIGNVRPRRCDPGELMTNLEEVWRGLGRRPGCVQLKRRGRFGSQAYCMRWGSVRRACELLAAHHRGEITREELLAGTGPKRAYRKTIPHAVRWRVLKRDAYRCAVCGKSPATHRGVDLEVDHIVALARGGTDEDGNLRTLCGACNRGKGDE
jgi:hypothetical protein